ncbi:bifunctional UDP-N-acetylmuramoyl-tripeptide:D-alanyl-D-alanine ligase/alanine racemase [Marinilongibacter aquaticus]|uniref:bifunctional UDP-N-acetylmuramoyl-tripeptide:D-alanyl-D-alanine ligase/alanine racemase n=1 Tax=Marinilongibacter aquaticus TaxID=2975157 RepID=UPI0021BD993B|nr:bifunctional UDP-N-acetylmuramoyl-tripeptide:D-alanyl-D-alanine ligase/alanine racemase [Marinilongibacter aquaticus]UBM58304.1 bifunctional UDP-N-acetylmuramoyl-tripeptide:D-alanyl-D-alanine ligase/alanine racemase [Marinilongibacter aquaticus]
MIELSENTLLLTDSRFLSQAENTLFIAIKGERHDGHRFIPELIEKGVTSFLVNNEWHAQHTFEDKNLKFYAVENTVKAFQDLVKKHRSKFKIPVVGITGSNGKTIVKEWLNTILSQKFSVIKSPRSYNSQIGVPLSVWPMQENHEIAIFEAGISKPAEMQALAEIIQPTIGIFTNIGSAHNEGFRSQKQKITEKLQLFRSAKTLIYSQDYQSMDQEIRIFLKAVNPKLELIGWSTKQKGAIPVEVYLRDHFSEISIYWNSEEYTLRLPFIDEASIENGIHCFFAAYEVLKGQMPEKQILSFIQTGFDQLKPVAMRLELKDGINQCSLIDDSYNNDFGGLQMALNFMNQHHIHPKRSIILSDVLQTGWPAAELYAKISHLLKGAHIEKVIGIGPEITAHAHLFDEIETFATAEDFLESKPQHQFAHELILIKGAREFAFEKIVNAFQQKVHGTVLEVNLDAITHNLNYYRSLLKGRTKLMVMVKASAYGSGSREIASLMQYHRVDYLAVAYTDEGVELREAGIETPIMVLNTQTDSFKKLIDHRLEPEIYSISMLRSLLSFIKHQALSSPLSVHLKLDTGMHRLGFEPKDFDELVDLLKTEKHIKVASLFSHLAASDDKTERAFTLQQIERFTAAAKTLKKKLGIDPICHMLNSAGILNFPEAHFDMVRLGIGLYGIESSQNHQEELWNVASLKTTISQIKSIKAGDTIGYGRHGRAEEDMQIATIAIGYADGFNRHFGQGNGEVFIQGKRCKTIGNICMDMCMIDVSGLSVSEGDLVEIFGNEIPIFDLAKKLNSIPYEVLTSVGGRVKRIFYKE